MFRKKITICSLLWLVVFFVPVLGFTSMNRACPRIRRSWSIWIVAFILLPSVSSADPTQTQQVQDQTLEQAANTISETLNKIYPEITQQSSSISSLNRTIQEGITGTTGAAAFNNLKTEQDFRDWTPNSADLANMVREGLQTGSLADQIKYYDEKFRIPKPEQLDAKNPNSLQADYGVFSAVSTNTAFSVADKGFDNVDHILKQLNLLYKQVDQQQTLKQSVDLNSILLLRIAALQTDLIRLQAQQLKMQAVSQQENNNKRTIAAQFIHEVGSEAHVSRQ